VQHLRVRIAGTVLVSFLAVASVAFAVTATHEPLEDWVAACAIAAFALFLVAQQFVMLAAWRRSVRDHREATTVQGRFDAAAESSGGWLYVLDAESRFVYCSDASLECVGYPPAELLGTSSRELLSQGEVDHLDPIATAKQAHNSQVVRARHRNGEDRWLECVTVPVVDVGSQAPIFWTGTARLLTDANHPAVLREIHRRAITALLATEAAITIAFQPIVDLASGRVVGVEALSRFPTRTNLTPDVIFAEAANAGLGLELELLAVRTALRQAHHLDPRLYVAVNVSPAVLANVTLTEAIKASGIDSGRIVVEVTEHTSIVDYTLLEEPRQRLRDLGIRLAIDDAGAGYASLRHIVTLSPDMIKIDRTLIADIDSDRARRALVMAVVMFALEIGTTTIVAEGVETSPELETLTLLGVDSVQGYLIGRPTTHREDWLRWGPAAGTRWLPPEVSTLLDGAEAQPPRKGSHDGPASTRTVGTQVEPPKE
jgi:PAS domain S-box-containing protein